MTRKRLSRRAVLRGLGLTGVAIALPPLEAMIEPRGAQAAVPPLTKRLVTYWWPNGVPLHNFTPAAPGVGWARPAILEGLREVAEAPGYDALPEISVLTGLGQVGLLGAGNSDHDSCTVCALTGVKPVVGSEGQVIDAAAPSLDKIAGDAIGAGTKLKYLPVALQTKNASKASGRWSWDGPQSPRRPFCDPQLLFDQLFLDYVSPDQPNPELEALRARQASILDYVRTSIGNVKAGLGAEDRARLDDHLEAIYELETKISAEGIACIPPTNPNHTSGEVSATNSENADLTVRSELLLELSVMALRCDLTRVVTFSIGPSVTELVYPGCVRGDHTISHDQNKTPGPAGVDPSGEYTLTTRWKVSRFARLIHKLRQQADVTGNLLDNTVVVGLSEMTAGGGHVPEMLPVLIAGGAPHGGRHIVLPCSSPTSQILTKYDAYGYCAATTGVNTELRSLWLTALSAAGAQVSDFGGVTTTLPGLWA